MRILPDQTEPPHHPIGRGIDLQGMRHAIDAIKACHATLSVSAERIGYTHGYFGRRRPKNYAHPTAYIWHYYRIGYNAGREDRKRAAPMPASSPRPTSRPAHAPDGEIKDQASVVLAPDGKYDVRTPKRYLGGRYWYRRSARSDKYGRYGTRFEAELALQNAPPLSVVRKGNKPPKDKP